MRRASLICTPLAFLLAGSGTLMAQSLETGAVIGVVKDASGKPVAGIPVRATSAQTTRTVVTDGQGRYRLGLLRLGKWNLAVSPNGYQTSTATVVLGINDTVTLNFNLVPVATATVEVNAQAEALDLTTTQTTTNFSAERLAQLPSDATSVNALDAIVGTVPGVQSTGLHQFQFFGGASDQNLFVVDGNNTNNTAYNISYNLVNGLPPKEFMESIEVVTGGFGAEYNVLGGVINMATKSGSNVWAGATYWYTNFPNSTAKQLYNADAGQNEPAPYNKNTRYGLTVGGPIVKDKVFFFLGVQGAKTVQPPAGLGGANWNGYVSSPATNNGPNTLSAKVNWIINPSHELVLSTTDVKQSFDGGNHFPSYGSYSTGSNNSGTHGYYNNQNTNLTWNWAATPRLFLVTSLGLHTDPMHTFANQPSPDGNWHPIWDFRYFIDGPGASAPNKPNGYQFFDYVGGSGAPTQSESNPNKQIRLDLTWAPSNHVVKAGYNLQRTRLDRSSSEIYGTSIYSNYVNYGMTGNPNDLEQMYYSGFHLSLKGSYGSYYVKDLWEFAPGLRLNYGLRFDTMRLEGVIPPNAGKELLNFSNLGRQIQPRLGVTWDVHRDGQTKLYADLGRFFETMALANFAWASSTSLKYSYWNPNQWVYNSTYGADQPAFTILSDPATGRPYAPYLTFNFGFLSENPPLANDLRLPHKDMLLLGGDQVLKNGWTVGGNLRWWKVADPIVRSHFTNPDGSNAFPGDVSTTVVWNPRPGPVTFTAGNGKVLTWNSLFPDPKEVYLALNLHARLQRENLFLTADYTWTHHYGNFRGLTASRTAVAANATSLTSGQPNDTSDWYYYQTIASGNNEANPVHELKLTCTYGLLVWGQKVNISPVFLWQTGFGLTKVVPITNILPNAMTEGANWDYAPDNKMSNMGHTPTHSNLDLNLDTVIKAGPVTITPSVAITNVFNTRAIAGYGTEMERGAIPGDPHPLNPYFGMPMAWQPGRTITAGVSIKF